MKVRWWLTVLVCCVVAGQVWGCCGDQDVPSHRVERSAGRQRPWRHRNGTRGGRQWGIVKRALRRIPLDRWKEIQTMDLSTLLKTVRGVTHPEFVNFAVSNVSRPTTTGTGLLGAGRPNLLGAGRPNPQGSKPSALQKDLQDVASERRSVIKDAGCKPRKVPVEVPVPDDPLLLYTPSCVMIPRCSGCCGHELLECVPTEVKNIRKKVLALRFSEEDISLADQEQSIIKIKMEKHVQCGCQCKVKESSCRHPQVYDAANCRCLCSNDHEAASCAGTKIWSESDCSCKCARVTECSTGLEFDAVQCRCLPSSSSRPLLFGAATQAPSGCDCSPGGSTAATPTVPGRQDSQHSPAVTGGAASSGWGTALSSGVIEDRPPPPRRRPARPARPSQTYSGYQTASPNRRYDQAASPDRRYDQTASPDRRYDQAASPDRRYDQAASPDRRYDQTAAESRHDQRNAASRNDHWYDAASRNYRRYD